MGNELAVTESMPDYLAEYAKTNAAVADIDIKELRIPLLKRVELLSVEFDAKKNNFGHIVNSITGEDYGTSVEVVVLKQFINWVKFKEKKLIGRSESGTVWETGDISGSELTEEDKFKCKHYNFYVLVVRRTKDSVTVDPIPHFVIMSNTSAKEGNKLYNIIGMGCVSKKIPMYSYFFKFYTQEKKEDTNTFSVWKTETVPGFVPKNIFEQAKSAREIIDSKATVVEGAAGESANVTPGKTPEKW